MSRPPLELTTERAAGTTAVGGVLAEWLREGDVVLLHGDLGAGKTTLAKGVAAALSVADVVSSPSFALVNEYAAGPASPIRRVYHLDLYRLRDEDDLASIGFTDYVPPVDGITMIEWPERAALLLPDRYLLIELALAGPDRRYLRIIPHPADDSWDPRFEDLRRRLAKQHALESPRYPPLSSEPGEGG